jgi:hypothetical protein
MFKRIARATVWAINSYPYYMGKRERMRLYVKVDENNKWVRHPNTEENLWYVFPYHIFLFGPPKGFMEFVRDNPPILKPYEMWNDTVGADISLAYSHNGLEYGIVDGKYTDIWHAVEMTEEEIKEKQEYFKEMWKVQEKKDSNQGFPSWVFNEKTCRFDPPTPSPNCGECDGGGYDYDWNEKELRWDRIFIDGKEWTGVEGSTLLYKMITDELKREGLTTMNDELGNKMLGKVNSIMDQQEKDIPDLPARSNESFCDFDKIPYNDRKEIIYHGRQKNN